MHQCAHSPGQYVYRAESGAAGAKVLQFTETRRHSGLGILFINVFVRERERERARERERELLFVGCLTSQQHASVSQGRICSDNFTCCHTQIEVADPTFYLTQSQYDTGPTSPSADPITPGARQGSYWSVNV